MKATQYSWLRESELARLVCLVPVYGPDGGNYTEVWFDNGDKVTVRYRVPTVAKNTAAFLGVSRHQSSAAWHRGKRRHGPPIVLPPGITLVALPVRRPLYRDHGGIGYVVLQKIDSWERIEEGEFRTRLHLAGGHRLNCLLKIETLELRLLDAAKVSHRSRELFEKLSKHQSTRIPIPFCLSEIKELTDPGGVCKCVNSSRGGNVQ
ncbi:MAG: hypothetical protein IMW96_06555 [Thermoanaerobacteraceae bacterium]|nr:hypothetical protein [Thermoanaerobacteraceae bacterium]